MTEDTLPHLSQINAFERVAVRYLRWRNPRSEPCIQRWTPEAYQRIRYLEITAIALAAFSGMVSGFLIGGLEVWLNFTYPDTSESWREWWEYWALFLGLSVLVSIAEIIFLYWVVLWRVGQISAIAGLRLSGAELDQVIAIGLSRSALDVPDPRKPIFGVDPYLRVPRWKLWVFAILYRLKIGATSFIVRILLRRVLARAALRALIPLVAIVIYSVWNAVIIGWVMRAARVRAAGPVAIEELSARLHAARDDLDPELRELLLEGVAEAIIRSANDHPNFVLLLARLFDDLDLQPQSIKLDWADRQAQLQALNPEQQNLVLDVIQLTLMLDGRPTRKQRRFVRAVHDIMQRPYAPEALQHAYAEFHRGQGLAGFKG